MLIALPGVCLNKNFYAGIRLPYVYFLEICTFAYC